MIDENYVYEKTDKDGNVTLVPNQQVLLPHLTKAFQELNSEVQQLKQQVIELQKGV